MLLLEGYISNFTCAKHYFVYVEFSDFYVNQSLAGQTLVDGTDALNFNNLVISAEGATNPIVKNY
jgi:hypothetical protein